MSSDSSRSLDDFTLDDLLILGEVSRRHRYAMRLLAGLCRSPGREARLVWGQPVPEMQGIDPVDHPTCRELVDYLQKAFGLKTDPGEQSQAIELAGTYGDLVLHAETRFVNGRYELTLWTQRDGAARTCESKVADGAGWDRMPKRAPNLKPDDVICPIPIDEFERRIRLQRPDAIKCGLLAVLLLLSLVIGIMGSVFLWSAERTWAVVAAVLAAASAAGLIRLVKWAQRSELRHGLCCPYCRKSLLEEWRFHRRPRSFQDRFARLRDENTFSTGLCHECKAEVIVTDE